MQKKKIAAFLLATLIIAFATFSITTVFYQKSLILFIAISLLFFSSGLYFKYYDVQTYLSKLNLEDLNQWKAAKIFFCVALTGVPCYFIYTNNMLGAYTFLVDNFTVNKETLIIILQAILVPLIVIIAIGPVKDLYNIMGQVNTYLKSGPKNIIEDKKTIAFLIVSFIVGAYFAHTATNLAVLNMQMYQLTVVGDNVIYPVPDILYYILLISTFIMASNIIFSLCRKIEILIRNKEKIDTKIVLELIFGILQITISSFSFSLKTAGSNILTAVDMMTNSILVQPKNEELQKNTKQANL